MKKRQVHIFADSEILDKFQRLYSGCLTKFVIRAITLAVTNKLFFNSVFFGDDDNDD